MGINKEYNIFLYSQFSKQVMAMQLAILLLVLIYKQGMEVQPINMPVTGYKADRYITELND